MSLYDIDLALAKYDFLQIHEIVVEKDLISQLTDGVSNKFKDLQRK